MSQVVPPIRRTGDLSERGAFHCRGDGRGAAAHGALAQHQGAARLLLRGLRWPGAGDRDGRSHAGASRLHADVGAGGGGGDRGLRPATSRFSTIPMRAGRILPDITMVLPVFLPGFRSAWVLCFESRSPRRRGRLRFAGSMGPARGDFQEGIRIPPVRIVRGGTVDREMLDLILLNVRTPRSARAILGADRRLPRGRAAHSRVGREVRRARLRALADELLDYSERLVRAELRACRPASSAPRTGWTTTASTTSRSGSRSDSARSGGGRDSWSTLRVVAAGAGQCECGAGDNAFGVLLCAALPFAGRRAGDGGHSAAAHAGDRAGSIVDARPPGAGGRGQRGDFAAHCGRAAAGAGAGDSGRVPAASAGTMSNLTIGGIDPRTASRSLTTRRRRAAWARGRGWTESPACRRT
jgi:N-methylhydantoinase B